MVTPHQKTIATIIAGVIIAVMPALLGYLQSRDEIAAKYQKTQDEATSGYNALVTSVKEIQAAMTVQHDYIVKLEGHLEAMDKYVMGALRARPVTGRPAVVAADPPAPIPPPTRPKFRDPPADFGDATQQFAPKH